MAGEACNWDLPLPHIVGGTESKEGECCHAAGFLLSPFLFNVGPGSRASGL